LTEASTPSIRLRRFSMRAAHDAQVMPSMASSTEAPGSGLVTGSRPTTAVWAAVPTPRAELEERGGSGRRGQLGGEADRPGAADSAVQVGEGEILAQRDQVAVGAGRLDAPQQPPRARQRVR
jgi:hypothetical protein